MNFVAELLSDSAKRIAKLEKEMNSLNDDMMRAYPSSGYIPQQYVRHCAILRSHRTCPKISEHSEKLIGAPFTDIQNQLKAMYPCLRDKVYKLATYGGTIHCYTESAQGNVSLPS